MSLILNGKNISKVYLGEHPIVKIYKGDTLVYKMEDGDNGQLELTFASAVSSGANLFKYNGSTYYTATKDYAVGDVLVIDDLPPLTSLSFNGYNKYSSNKALSKIDTSNVTDMSSMFRSCSKLTSLDLSNFNTSNVTDMSFMFSYCSNLTSLDVTNFNTSKVTNMYYMFGSCYNLTSLDVTNFDTSKVTNMYYMFDSCSKLTNIAFGEGWGKNTSALTLDLSSCGTLTAETFNSMLNMYDRAANGLSAMTIQFSSSKVGNMPSGWQEAMAAKGYTITLS